MKIISISLFLFANIFCITEFQGDKNFDILSQILILVPTLYIFQFFITKYKSFTFYFLSIFYILGYPIFLAILHKNFHLYNSSGWLSVGNFEFTSLKIRTLCLASFLIMFGLSIGFYFNSRFNIYTNKINLYPYKANSNIKFRLKKAVNIWFISSLIIIIFMSLIGIGRTGLIDKIQLPFGIKAILYYSRLILIPLVGIYFLQASLAVDKFKLTINILIKIIILSVLIAFLSLSRSDIVITLSPVFIFLFATTNNSFKKKISRLLLISVIFIVFVTQFVQIFRNISYSNDSFDYKILTEQVNQYSISDIGENILVLLTLRQGGSRDLGVVLNSPYNDTKYIIKYFFQENEEAFMTDVWNFNIDEFLIEGMSFGAGFNGFAWYAFGSNYLVIFLLSFITGSFLCYIELLFRRNNFYSVQIWLGLMLAILSWNTFLWLKFSRIIPFLFISLYIIKKIRKYIFYEQNKKIQKNFFTL